jgi:tRNA 2-thiouridine synthesizing protein E
MTTLIQTLMEMERGDVKDPLFPHAPEDWTPRLGRTAAKVEGLVLTEEHWAVVAALQDYFARHGVRERNMLELHDALEERFHASGGMRYLYQLFPGGPVAQGCRIAGLHVNAVDRGFGSVMQRERAGKVLTSGA